MGEFEGDVDPDNQEWQGQEVQASQLGPLHLKDAPVQGLGHHSLTKPTRCLQVEAPSLPSELAPLFCEDLPFVLGIIKS